MQSLVFRIVHRYQYTAHKTQVLRNVQRSLYRKLEIQLTLNKSACACWITHAPFPFTTLAQFGECLLDTSQLSSQHWTV